MALRPKGFKTIGTMAGKHPLYHFPGTASEAACAGDGKLTGEALIAPSNPQKELLERRCDYLISIFTKIKIQYAFKLYQQSSPPEKNVFFA